MNVDPGKWAIASGYDGPDIEEKTLVSWVIMDDLDVQEGSILTVDRLSNPTFDAIVLENVNIVVGWQGVAGSSHYGS